MKETRKRGFAITNNGISLIEQKMKEKGLGDIDLTFEAGLDKEGKAITRIRNGHRPQRKTIQAIAKVLDINPTDLVDPQEWYRSSKDSTTSPSAVNWRSVSKGMLEDLKRLTTEALTAGDGIRFDFDDVFVPLGVVERQQKTKRKEDDGAPDRGSELYEEKVTPITHDEFFEDVLLQGNTRYSDGKRIAVIGEAGAGKTTQLQKIGSWLLEESDDIPIWISLTDLGAKSLREYLFENWVREASGEIEAAPQAWKDSLGEAIKSGKVWLLLDGVDEMTVNNPLSHLANELKESWLKNVRVVLTCRVNVWDGGKNALTGFDVYRNLDFDYPDDVYKFIGKWFVRSPDLAESLTQALEQSGKERIRDMVKNPLRLTLLCYSWQLKQGELPETKAGLYDWFVDAFYEWNKGKTKIELTRSKRDELNRELGELAKLAIDSKDSRFRLTKTFIENAINYNLFELALELNWLNEVGVAAENPLEKVYAFYHPSFQEYFAALSIKSWKFLLNRQPNIMEPKSFRVFDKEWEEVVLFWIGKPEENSTKHDFIDTLMNDFQPLIDIDIADIIYKIQAYFIASKCLVEFKNYYQHKRILDIIIDLYIGYLDLENKSWNTLNILQIPSIEIEEIFHNTANHLYQEVTEILLERLAYSCCFQNTDRFSNESEIYCQFTDDIKMRFKISEKIIDLNKDKSNISLIHNLKNLLANRFEEQVRLAIAFALFKLDLESNIGRDELTKLLYSSAHQSIRKKSQEIINNVDRKYIDIYQQKYNNFSYVIKSLQDLKDISKDTVNISSGICQTYWYEILIKEIIMSGHALNNGYEINPEISIIFKDVNLKRFLIDLMLNVVESSDVCYLDTMRALENIAVGDKKAIEMLEDIIDKTQEPTLYENAAYTLRRIDKDNQKAVSVILKLTKENIKHLELNVNIADILVNSQEDFKREIYLDNISDNLYYLGYIDKNNSDLVIELHSLLKDTTVAQVQLDICRCILSFDSSNSIAISFLVCLFTNSEDYNIISNSLLTLIEYLGWKKGLTYLINRFSFREPDHINFYSVCGLIKEQINLKEIPDFISFIKLYPHIHWKFAELLWHFSRKIRYQEFYNAWNNELSGLDANRLEKQFMRDIVQASIDTSLDYPEIRCLVIDFQDIEQESDPNIIAKKLTNKIFNSIGRRIPVVQDVSCLERELLNLKFDLGVEKLAIALYGKSANEAISQLCQSLTESIPIRPFTGGQTTQELISQINAWLSEM